LARSGELSARQVAALTAPGRHRVADNLFLLLKPPRKSWLNMFTCPVTRREHEMGLGPVSLVSVPQAKAIVLRHRTLVHEGRCPLCEKRGRTRAAQPVTFKEVADPLAAGAVA
jgi:Arm DNA-binding domain